MTVTCTSLYPAQFFYYFFLNIHNTALLRPQISKAICTMNIFGKQIQEPRNGFPLLVGQPSAQKAADHLENTGAL